MIIDDDEIIRIATKAASANLHSDSFAIFRTRTILDAAGNEAVRITIGVKPEAEDRVTGDAVLRTIEDIQSEFDKAGDDRLPIVEFASEADRAEAKS